MDLGRSTQEQTVDRRRKPRQRALLVAGTRQCSEREGEGRDRCGPARNVGDEREEQRQERRDATSGAAERAWMREVERPAGTEQRDVASRDHAVTLGLRSLRAGSSVSACSPQDVLKTARRAGTLRPAR